MLCEEGPNLRDRGATLVILVNSDNDSTAGWRIVQSLFREALARTDKGGSAEAARHE